MSESWSELWQHRSPWNMMRASLSNSVIDYKSSTAAPFCKKNSKEIHDWDVVCCRQDSFHQVETLWGNFVNKQRVASFLDLLCTWKQPTRNSKGGEILQLYFLPSGSLWSGRWWQAMGSTSIPEWSSLRITGKWRWIHMFCSLGWTFSQLPLQKKPTRKIK